MKKHLLTKLMCLAVTGIFWQYASGQVELSPWGNIAGIRIDGQLMDFESSLRVVKPGWTGIKSTGKEKQRPMYARTGNQQVVTTRIDSISFTEKADDLGAGRAKISVAITTNQDEDLQGVFFCLSLPFNYQSKATVQEDKARAVALTADSNKLNDYFKEPVRKIQFSGASRGLEFDFEAPLAVTVKNEPDKAGGHLQLYIPVHAGNFQKGQAAGLSFSIRASGIIDHAPIALVLDAGREGKVFDGFGGNFRLQNPVADPQVIDYCLSNLRVAWSRVEMPWRFWQPEKKSDPVAAAKAGQLNPQVQHAMEMARRVGKMGIPFILSAWSAPARAIVGPPKFRPGPDGVWGNPLDTASMQEIYKSIANYIIYLKENFDVEASLFSFNESDIGINIRQTGAEHAALIRGLGAYFKERGLQTKLLLGDNSDATTYRFIYPALNDPATYPYIGAVSFHSWRGWETETLQQWADAAHKINRPLLVAEGSIDAQAWGYPAIFEEPTYALQEISLYMKLLAVCQPLSILQWQLTSDYSPLAGGGIFGNSGPLHPTQRFWNLKQLASTPKGLKALPLRSNKTDVAGAALGDRATGIYVLHIVNNGAARKVLLSGLPPQVKKLSIFETSAQKAMQEGKEIPVHSGAAEFMLAAGTYATLSSR